MSPRLSRPTLGAVLPMACAAAGVAACSGAAGGAAGGSGSAAAAAAAGGAPPTYELYVANESSDLVSRVAFTPGRGARVVSEIPVGVMPGDNDGVHGVTVWGDDLYVTIAHGTPYGSVWKFHAGPDTLVAREEAGLFPATMAASPDGRFLVVANFNLHGDRVPSDLSVLYTPDLTRLSRVTTCVMPHGSRIDEAGARHYSACMGSDELVELDLASLAVARRLSVGPGHGEHGAADAGTCSPTWVEPGRGARANRVVYVACNRRGEVLEVDVERWAVARRFPTGAGPYNLEAVAGGRLLAATLKGEAAVALFDLERGEEVARVATSRPVTHGLVASPDGRWLFVTNEAVGATRGTLDVVDLEARERVATVELRHQSGGVDLWRVVPAAGAGGP